MSSTFFTGNEFQVSSDYTTICDDPISSKNLVLGYSEDYEGTISGLGGTAPPVTITVHLKRRGDEWIYYFGEVQLEIGGTASDGFEIQGLPTPVKPDGVTKIDGPLIAVAYDTGAAGGEFASPTPLYCYLRGGNFVLRPKDTDTISASITVHIARFYYVTPSVQF